jgi:SAM-dependent methyltransferase
MTRAAKTPYVVNYDADVILMPWQIIDMANRLRNGADMVYPYDGRFAGVDRSLKDTDPYYTQWIGVNHRQMMSMAPLPVIGVPGSVGGSVGFNKKRYLNIGGENENFISWGPEDVERYWRASLFGYRIERTPGTLYHIDHYRGPNSTMATMQSMDNHNYWDRLQRMTKEQVMEHLGLVNHEERGYPGGWKLEDAIKEHAFSLELAYHIYQLIKDYTTVYDLGSGPGFYARFLSQRGMDVLAVDAGDTRDISLFPAACLDITTMHSPARDVVLCLEVGEHVPREHEAALLDSLCRHAIHMVILSWAIPGQGGFGHVNNASNAYVIEEMRQRGWAYLAEPSQYLRERCSGADWFGETVMCFNKGGVI